MCWTTRRLDNWVLLQLQQWHQILTGVGLDYVWVYRRMFVLQPFWYHFGSLVGLYFWAPFYKGL